MRYRRDHRGNCYFFTLVTFDRQPFLTGAASLNRLRSAFAKVRARHPFEITAAVILPDHLHCIWELPVGDTDFAMRWMLIKREYSLAAAAAGDAPNASRQRRRERAIWQRRYWEHRVRDDEDMARHLDYLHYNPVKHGLVPSPWAWPHSSLLSCARRGWYLPGWGENPDTVKPAPRQTGE